MCRVSVGEEITEGWRKLRNEEPDNLYFLSDIRMKNEHELWGCGTHEKDAHTVRVRVSEGEWAMGK